MTDEIDGALVRAQRLARGWSQEQLAEVAGLGVRTIQRIEQSGSAGMESRRALAGAFELALEELAPAADRSRWPLVVAMGASVLGFAAALAGSYSSLATGAATGAEAGVAMAIAATISGGACAAIGVAHARRTSRAALVR